jgi:hypothetical protein
MLRGVALLNLTNLSEDEFIELNQHIVERFQLLRSARSRARLAQFPFAPRTSSLGRPPAAASSKGQLGYSGCVSPTILRIRGYRFYFFSREEPRAHVHVQHAEGEAKFWIEPTMELAVNHGLRPRRLAEVVKILEEHYDDIRHAWAKHFPG